MTSAEATSRGTQQEGPLPPDRRRECYSWRAAGLCRFGNSCRYAHDDDKAYTPPDFQHRQWSHSQASTSASSSTGGSSPRNFSLMSYNVLADELALDHAKELYKAVPDWCLRWSLRVKKILSEILHWRPDVICLQEIDHPQDFSDFLDKEGFDWKYAARTGGRPDGCLTLWRREAFDLVASETIHMSDFSLRDNVGLIVVLRVRSQGSTGSAGIQEMPLVAIANTHLIFNPKRGDIKLGQAGLILRRIGEASQGFAQPPLTIFTGDFNSTPESAVYTFVRDGELDCYTEDRRNLSGQLEREEKGWPPSSIASSRNFNLRAALVGQDRIRGTSLDDPSRSYRTQLAVKAGGEMQEPVVVSTLPVTPETASIQIVTSQAKGSMIHSESFPSVAKSAGDQEGRPLQSPRFSGPILSAPGQAPLYPYTDQFGQVAWSYMPPSNADIKRQPFFHEPMRVEEDRPQAPPSPPPGIFRTLSFAQRQINAGTWTTEQLMVATGYRPADGYLNTTANGRSQYPRPSPTDVWLAEHPLPLQSAYKTVLGAEPAFTSCHSKFIGTVDYVWFTPEAGSWSLRPIAVLLPPPLESLHCGLPSPEWPSDHISLLANFSILERQGCHSGAADPMAELEKQSMPAVQHTHFTD